MPKVKVNGKDYEFESGVPTERLEEYINKNKDKFLTKEQTNTGKVSAAQSKEEPVQAEEKVSRQTYLEGLMAGIGAATHNVDEVTAGREFTAAAVNQAKEQFSDDPLAFASQLAATVPSLKFAQALMAGNDFKELVKDPSSKLAWAGALSNFIGIDLKKLGIFGSLKGQKPPTGALQARNEMYHAKNDPTKLEEIRQRTGWSQGADGSILYEIDDSKMEVADQVWNAWRKDPVVTDVLSLAPAPGSSLRYTFGSVHELIKHDELFANYPGLKQYKIGVSPIIPKGDAQIDFDTKEILLSAKDLDEPFDELLKRNLVHELQHAVQNIEGLPSGTNVRAAGSYEKYRSNPGEVQANNAVYRMDMTAEERKATKPVTTRMEEIAMEHQGNRKIFDQLQKEVKASVDRELQELGLTVKGK